ncbi:MAG: hypothetical protein CMJ58_04820 [Planctomycetaceae bacterium]|nr:hypothetical protein [Planctomycetaceae bacterium]
MNVSPAAGLAGSAAGAPLSQTKGSDSERAARDATDQSRAADGQDRSEKAAGIGQMQEDAETHDRDADGRRMWEESPQNGEQPAEEQPEAAAERHRVKDPKGESGNSLDLMG